jgi:hypothetical protein
MEKEKPFSCETCGKRYKNLNGLKYVRLSKIGYFNFRILNVMNSIRRTLFHAILISSFKLSQRV